MKSFLSVLLSGTPAQVKPLIPSAENGLFSRQMFYYMPSITEWVNQFDLSDEDYDSRFTGWGKQWKTFIEWLRASVNLIQLKLSEEQKIRFNERFGTTFRPCGFHAWGSHEKYRGTYRHQHLPNPKRGGPATSHGNSSRHTKQFSILNSPFSNAPVSPLPMTYRKRMSETVSYRNWT